MPDGLFALGDDMDVKPTYRINGDALKNPAAYTKICGSLKRGDVPEELEKKSEGVGQP